MGNQNSLPEEGEISLIDILRFLKSVYKISLLFGVMGIIAAITYLAITPKQYEAVARIALAQISATGNNKFFNPLGVNIEEPTLLIARLSSPTSFTPQILSSCGIDDNNPGASLANAIKLAPIKGAVNLVELKAFGKSPEVAYACAQAIFELVKITQDQILTPYIEAVKARLAHDEERLIKINALVSRTDKTSQSVGVAYLSTRDEISYLLDEITILKINIIQSQNGATRLIVPIYVSNSPVAPNRLIVLMAGLLGGLSSGLLLALARQICIKLKADLQDQKQSVP